MASTERFRACVLAAVVVAATANVSRAQQPGPAPTVASTIDRQISTVEKLTVEAADAMPADRFDFSPESLHVPGSAYKGVRTFAVQVKHLAASNFFLWASVTGDKIPDDYKGGDGPASLKTKSEIIAFLKESFAMGHKAAATLTPENMLAPAAGSTSTRLHFATFAVEHAYDSYGQIVEYLRMNGIVPPASQ
jgi:hypothetical protein